MRRLTTEEPDVSQLELSDIIDFQALRSLIEDFYSVIGVAVGAMKEGQNLNFAIPSKPLAANRKSSGTVDHGNHQIVPR